MKTAMQELKDKIQYEIEELNGELNEYKAGYKQCLINIQNDIEDVHDSVSNVIDVMIEFAKLHVEVALKEKEKQIEKLKDFDTWKEWKNRQQ